MPGTLKCHGVVRELKEVGVGGGNRGVRSRGSLGQREKSSHTGAGLRAYQRVLDAALPRGLLRQTRCSVGCSVPLRVRYSPGQPEAPRQCKREATVQFKLTADGFRQAHGRVLGPAVHPLDLAASFEKF